MIVKFGEYIFEYLQLADKLYFKTDKLSKQEKNLILSITNGDYYTKILCDLYLYLTTQNIWLNEPLKVELKDLYYQLVNYNKNVFPIKKFNIEKIVDNLYFSLKERKKILDIIKDFPSVAIRNLKNDIRLERDFGELSDYLKKLEYLYSQLAYLNNRTDNIKYKILKKLFKSNRNIDDLINFVEEKENLLGGEELTKEHIITIINEYKLKIIFEKDNIMVIEVDSADAIKKIGCNSLWCFTYGDGYNVDWENYSTNNIVYVIINFSLKSDNEDFMYVLLKPLEKKYNVDDYDSPLYNMANQQMDSPLMVLKYIFGKINFRKFFTFK